VLKNKKDIIYSLANKYELSIDIIERVVTYQFKFVTDIMAKGKFETIRLPYFGKFSVNKNRVNYITKLKNEANKGSINNS
jgi:nucleoid DNA-binding protein